MELLEKWVRINRVNIYMYYVHTYIFCDDPIFTSLVIQKECGGL